VHELLRRRYGDTRRLATTYILSGVLQVSRCARLERARPARLLPFPCAFLAFLLVAWTLSSSVVTARQSRSVAPGEPTTDAFAALSERRFGDALELFEQIAKTSPRNAPVLLGAGVASLMLGNSADAQRWIERALTVQPIFPAAYGLLGEVLYRRGDLAKAIEALAAGVAQEPGNAELSERLARWQKEAKTQERFFQSQSAHFMVLFEGPTDEALARRAMEILETAYWRIGNVLSTYPVETTQVVLYTTEQFRDITRSPEWAGGAADGRIKIPIRGALDRPAELERVLTHEFVHVAVESIGGPTVPTWLDEGLATVLEPGGLEWSEQQLQQDPTRLPASRLRGRFNDLSAAEARAAYAQSATAVRKIIDLRSASAVVNLLRAIGRGTPFETAFQQTVFVRYEDFIGPGSQ
jgi:tetratricopeptide (TPR) repeat protein